MVWADECEVRLMQWYLRRRSRSVPLWGETSTLLWTVGHDRVLLTVSSAGNFMFRNHQGKVVDILDPYYGWKLSKRARRWKGTRPAWADPARWVDEGL